MAKIICSILILVIISFTITDGALSCYSCDNCGVTWDESKAQIVQTGNANHYCRKTVTGIYVTKDSSASCTSMNILGHGIFCCQEELCNSANENSIRKINFSVLIALLWTMYFCIF